MDGEGRGYIGRSRPVVVVGVCCFVFNKTKGWVGGFVSLSIDRGEEGETTRSDPIRSDRVVLSIESSPSIGRFVDYENFDRYAARGWIDWIGLD